MPGEVTIERITVADAQSLLDFAYPLFYNAFIDQNEKADMDAYINEAFTIENFTKELENIHSHFFWARLDGMNVAWIKLNEPAAGTEEVGGIEIQRIYVDDKHRGLNIGSQLLQFAEKFTVALSYNIIWLGVWDQNPKAIKFYKKNGYEIFDQHAFKFGSQIQNDFLMKKEL